MAKKLSALQKRKKKTWEITGCAQIQEFKGLTINIFGVQDLFLKTSGFLQILKRPKKVFFKVVFSRH
jgi:hypothetical protein